MKFIIIIIFNKKLAVLSFSACTPPLEELLKLWDFYFAFGCHLNIVSVVAQIVLEREELVKSETPNALLRTLPPINAEAIISLCSQLVAQLPIDIYDQGKKNELRKI